MAFVDPIFLFVFLPSALLVHRLALGRASSAAYPNAARLVLFGLTLVFYGHEHPWWLIPFAFSVGFDFVWASLLARIAHPGLRKVICAASVVQNLTLLGTFKYGAFIAGHFEGLVGPDIGSMFGSNLLGQPLPLPAGISFYTFESLSFVIDVYRRRVEPPRNPLKFFAFIAMFPRFIAGPIVRFRDLAGQIDRYAGMQIRAGLFTFVTGFFLKRCLADSFALFVPCAFGGVAAPGFLAAWIGALAYAMQLYLDFSGYSLMAIGLGRCLGFNFPQNFDAPYRAVSLVDFWRRWHMTLSAWLRDYLFFPVASALSNRFKAPTYLGVKTESWIYVAATSITMLLAGMWHGAGWTFLVWGGWHGTFLIADRFVFSRRPSWATARRIATAMVVLLGWVIFRSADLAETSRVLSAMAHPLRGTFSLPSGSLDYHPVHLAFCAAGILYCFVLDGNEPSPWSRGSLKAALGKPQIAVLLALLIGLQVWLVPSTPFLYFQF